MTELQEIPSTDPSPVTGEVSFTTLNNVYERIYRLGKDNKLASAGAAEEVTVSEDGSVHKVRLREESKWSDGEPVTTTDYVYGWQRVTDPATALEYVYMFEPAKNTEKASKGELPKEESGVKAVGDHESEITLETATPYSSDLLVLPSFSPQRQDIAERFDKDYTESSDKAVYNSPFALTEFDSPGINTKWSLTKNEEYQNKETVKLDGVAINVVKEAPTALNPHETDRMDDTCLPGELAQQAQNSPDLVQLKATSSLYLETNQADEEPSLTNANLRRAISYVIDRDSLVKNVLANDSFPSQGFVPVGVAKSPETGEDFVREADSDRLVKYDRKRAVEYWNKARQGLGVSDLTVDLVVNDSEGAKKMGEYLQRSLSDILEGLEITVTPVPMAIRLDRTLKGDFQIAARGWGVDHSDPANFLDLPESSTSNNRRRYSNPEYDKLVATSKTANVNDLEKRWEDLISAERTAIVDMDVVLIYRKAESHLHVPNMKEIIYYPTGTKYNFKWAYKG